VETRVLRHEEAYGLTVLQAAAGTLTVSRVDLPVGTPVRVRLRARDIILSLTVPEGISALNVLPGVVVAIEEAEGSGVDVTLVCGGDSIVASVTRKSMERLGIEVGLPVQAIVKSVAFDREALGTVRAENM